MDGYKSLFLKAASGEKSWVHPNITDKGKWKFYYSVNALVRLVLIRLEWIEGVKSVSMCVCAKHITDRSHMWHLMADFIHKDYEWIIWWPSIWRNALKRSPLIVDGQYVDLRGIRGTNCATHVKSKIHLLTNNGHVSRGVTGKRRNKTLSPFR